MDSEDSKVPQHPPSKKEQRKLSKNTKQTQRQLDNLKARKERLNKQFEELESAREELEKVSAEGSKDNETSDVEGEINTPSNAPDDDEKWSDTDERTTGKLEQIAITQTPAAKVMTTATRSQQIAELSNDSYKLNFDNVIKELNSWDFKLIQVDSKKLANSLARFIEVGSIIHKLTPDELTIVANLKGKYDNKEETLVEKIGDSIIPNTVSGLMANGTKFLDAVIYLSMEKSKRPTPTPTDMEPNDDVLDLPTYNDLVKLTTYMFVIFFYVLIRAHSPSDSGDYKGQPMPKFITTILGVHNPIGDIVDYVASFDLQKIVPAWVQNIPAKNISQKAYINKILERFGMSDCHP
ncbi:hypothetical protein EPUL_006668, partial [Erysiphe pulchra]